jgi:hypothetical protein
MATRSLLLLVIGLRQTSNLGIDFLTFKNIEVEGPDSGENLASIVFTVLCELGIGAKLLSITGDNAGNNPAMAGILSGMLEADFDTEILPHGSKLCPLSSSYTKSHCQGIPCHSES